MEDTRGGDSEQERSHDRATGGSEQDESTHCIGTKDTLLGKRDGCKMAMTVFFIYINKIKETLLF